jgi:carboxyl-terminal processing protease
MRSLTIILSVPFALSLWGAEPFQTDTNLIGPKFTNITELVARPEDPSIVSVVGQLLQRSHYRGQPLNDQVSTNFFNRYLDALDNQHIYFLKSDIEEFQKYRDQLDNLILEEGDATPARVIFNRFRERLNQQYDYAMGLLEHEKFTFDGQDRYLLNRKEEPRPKDLETAKQLWRDRLRYEYLQEKLSMGRPEAITQVILKKLEDGKADEIPASLKDKMSKEKAEEIYGQIKAKLGKESSQAITDSVLNRLHEDRAKEIVKKIARRYNRVLRSIDEYDNDDVLQVYLTALAHVYDPHSDYMGRAALENFAIGMKLSLFGIGALLRSEDGYCKIVSLTPNGPAERSKKLHPNDRIIAVAQGKEEPVDVVDMKLSKVVDLIRGTKGTEVRLITIPADAPDPSVRKTITLVRDEIKLEDQEAKAKLFEIPGEGGKTLRLGMIDLPSFYSNFDLDGENPPSEPKSTTTDVARLIKKLVEEKVSGIILDLRRNGGGSLEEAINLTGLFIKEGPVVQVRDPSGRVFVDKDPDPSIFYRGPLVVLTSRFSASASEILAGALQDYGRAVIVGDSTTHGKGTVQSLIQLGPILRQRGLPPDAEPGAIKMTIRKFYRASGASTQLKGVEPDLVLPSVNNYADVGESSLDNALEYDKIDPAEYKKFNWVEPYLADLRLRSQARIASNVDFAYIREDIERYKKIKADKTVSMNEAQRLKEKKEADERLKARKKELASRPPPSGKVFDISLKQAMEPGLPEAVSFKTGGHEAVQGKEDEKIRPAPFHAPAEDVSEDDEAQPNLDVALEEAKRILADFIALMTAKQGTLTASTPP